MFLIFIPHRLSSMPFFPFMLLFLSLFSATLLIPHVKLSTQTFATFVLCLDALLGSQYSHGYLHHPLKQ